MCNKKLHSERMQVSNTVKTRYNEPSGLTILVCYNEDSKKRDFLISDILIYMVKRRYTLKFDMLNFFLRKTIYSQFKIILNNFQ